MAELFAFGTFAFWFLLCVELVLLFVFVINENGLGATLSILAYVVILQWFSGIDLLTYSIQNWWKVGGFALLYFFVGTIWAFQKWRHLVNDYRESYDEEKLSWLRNYNVTDNKVPDHLKVKWQEHLNRSGGKTWQACGVYRGLSETPKAYDYKSKWLGWATFWVPSFIHYLLNDLVRRTFKSIFKGVESYLQSIADKKFKSVKDDLPQD